MRLVESGWGFRWALGLKEDPARAIGSCGGFNLRRGMATVERDTSSFPISGARD